MKISFPGQARGQFFDRNPVQVGSIGYFALGVVPHISTNRASYTVPAGKKAYVTMCSISTLRITAPAPAGGVKAWFFRLGDAGDFMAAFFDGTVGAKAEKAIGQSWVLAAGEIFRLSTLDGSTGGTVDYDCSAAIVEFDA